MLRDALLLARADLSQMLRRRETLLWVFAMPPLFFYFVGTVTGGFGRPRGEAPDPIALRAPADEGGFVVDELARRLEGQGYAVSRPAGEAELRSAPRRLSLVAPDGNQASPSAAVLARRQLKVVLEPGADPLRASYDQVRVARAVYGLVADLAVIQSEGGAASAAALRAVAARPRSLRLAVSSAGRRVTPPSGFAQAVPGILVMFTMLVLLTSGAILLVMEREAGLLRRLASTPIAPAAVVLGKWWARMALALVQIGFGAALGSALFGMDWGAALLMVGLVLFAWAAFNASLSLLLGSLARSTGQMAAGGVLSTMLLSALGGCWWPVEVAPAWMQRLALGLPPGWCMDALHKLVNFGEPAAAALPHATLLLAASLLVGWAAVRAFRYQ